MNPQKREAKRLAKKQAQLAALLGIEAPTPSATTSASPRQEAQFASREAEAVLAYYYTYDGSEWQRRDCAHCGNKFAVNRSNVAYCSDKCRKESLAVIGIDWDNTRTAADRWRRGQAANFVGEPLVVPHQAMQMVDELRQAETSSLQEADQPECTSACTEMHTYEQGCHFFFDLESLV